MTTATTEGRRLRLDVEGIDEAFLVDPLPARRGRVLTEEFLESTLGNKHPLEVAAIFIESFGPSNYARMAGQVIDEFTDAGEFVATHNRHGRVAGASLAPHTRPDGVPAVRYLARDDETAADDGEPIRQEECEALCIAAFYWQTVVGMEAVNEFLGDGGGSVGSLKALNLLLFRLGVSPSRTSPNSGLESLIQQQVATLATTTPSGGSTLAKLPPERRSRRPKRTSRRSRRSA